MQSFASIGRAVYRITLRRGSPQRVHYSPALTRWSLLAVVALAAAIQVLVFGSDAVGVVLYLFTWMCGLMLGVAFLSRRVPRGRLRTALQAALLILAAAHALLLPVALVAAHVPWLPYLLAGAVLVGVALGFINCVQYALASPRGRAVAYTLTFVALMAVFYVTMQSLLAIALV